MDKEVRKLIQSLTVIDGITVELNGSHAKVYKDGKLAVVIPKTPSDHRWRENCLSDLRKNGITPGTKIDKALRYSEGITMDEARVKLLAIKAEKKGTQAEFVRFLQDEVTPMLGLDGYKTFVSAEVSVAGFATGKQGLSEQKFVLVCEALRLWPAAQGRKAKQAALEPVEVEPVGIVRDSVLIDRPFPDEGTVRIELSLVRLNEILGGLGIQLTMNPGS